ncbi:MAG: DUF5343 domain-containing protein [Candidatus Pacebacteria bacterium]|nr:DUF5343 domain-containing protein [Candidatus Paceibacterota bacterium]
MGEKTKSSSPPYASFGAFVSFLNKLRDTVVPSRIDPTVFGNASGSISYSVIAALKFLKLIDDSGVPTKEFVALVKAADDARQPMLNEIVRRGYAPLFIAGVDLETITAGHFDEMIRKEYDSQGSTIDKIAAFFVAAAKAAGIPLSAHLLARKPIAQSNSSKKSAKQRKRENDDPKSENGDYSTPTQPQPAPQTSKALEYQLIDLMSENDIDESVKQSIWSLVQYLMARKAKKTDE